MSSSSSSLQSHLSTQLDTYLASFNAGDFPSAASHYHSPCVAISSSYVSVLPARADLAEWLARTVENLRTKGFERSEWLGPKKVVLLDPKGLALVSVVCRRLKGDGGVCEEFTATYTMQKVEAEEKEEKGGEGKWLIAAILQHPVETQLKGDEVR